MTYKWEAIAQDLTEERDRLLKENERLRKALERLGSMEALMIPRAISHPGDKELIARIDYARAALKSEKQ